MKLSYSILYVEDVKQSMDFYQKAFGIKPRFLHEGGDYAEMETGDTTLAFCAHELAEQIIRQPYQHAQPNQPIASQITLEPDSVKSAFEAAVAAGATIRAEPEVKPWNFEVAILQDPDGHLIELAKELAKG